MDGIPTLTAPDMRLAPAPWRWALLGFGAVAVAAALAVTLLPDAAGWTGFALVGGIGIVASLLLYSIWPRSDEAAGQDSRRGDRRGLWLSDRHSRG